MEINFFMKQLTEYKRVAGYLDKIFNLLNERYFENALSAKNSVLQSMENKFYTLYRFLSDKLLMSRA